jgi:tetratricopeptide (TPR) repeat protein
LTIDLSFLALALAEEHRTEDARAALADCATLLTEVGEGIEQVQLVHYNRALAHRALGDGDEAARSLQQAREVIDRLAAALPDPERGTFLAQRIPKRILEESQ